MAVRIPIITVFDSKGLKQAQYQLNKVRGNFQNLGRNFALAGAAFAGAAAVIVKSARDLARIEKINAQTEAVLKSMGNSAGVTSKHIQTLAGDLEKLTASEAETIQEGANLLLTFRNIQNQVGENNDIFDQAVKMSVDLSRAMGTDASGEAIRLGKALNDPVKGVSALTRVGVSFTEQQKEQIKTLSQSGDILGAQKIILAELQAQFGGSGQAYAATFAGQVELLNHELGALGEEATMAVMPALRDMITALRELAPEIGAKMASAIKSVDWKAFTKTIVDLITFLTQNAETIMKVVGAMFALNTIYNAGRVAVGLYNAAAVILGNTFTVTAGKIGLATGALKLFRTALMTTGIGAFVVALGFIIQGITEADSSYRKTTPVVTSFGTAVLNSGKDAEWAASKYGTAKAAIEGLNTASSNYRPPNLSGVIASEARRDAAMAARNVAGSSGLVLPDLPSVTTKPAGSSSQPATVAEVLKREGVLATREAKLLNTGVSQGLAGLIVGTATTKKAFQKELTKLTSSTKAVAKKQAAFNKTSAGKAEIASVQAASDARNAAQDAANDAAAARAAQEAAEQAAREKAILDEKKRVYESFANSIASTFSRIQESILGAFSLPELGGSTDSIIRNMNKLLARVKDFSKNITQLSSMGLDPRLLQQVINAGPMAGAKLAANLVAGGVGGLAAINAGFSELGGLASEIGMTGTQAQFGTAQQQQIININIEGGLDSSAAIGKAVVDAVRAYERTSGAVWQGA
jgi:hypothetical protein